MERRVSITDLKAMKKRGERIAMITAYDYPGAKLVEEAGAPIILVGDSLGMVVLGYDSTVPVTMDEMLHHVKAVVRGTHKAHVVADMPFMSYQTGPQDALRNAGRSLPDAVAEVILEAIEKGDKLRYPAGPDAQMVLTIRRQVDDEAFEAGMRQRLGLTW